MPLFIDFHQFEGTLSVEDVKAGHLADTAIQGNTESIYSILGKSKSRNNILSYRSP
jgi:hypothetical protein